MNIIDAMSDEKLFAPWFRRKWLRGDTWKAWRAFLCALFALDFEDVEAFETFKRHTGLTVRPMVPFTEANAICGRRGGKSLILALIVVYCAVFKDYSTLSVPGETLVAMLLASDKKQAAILLRYVSAFFDRVPMLTQMVESRTAEAISLTNGVTVLVATSDYRAVRGFSVVVCAADELAFWPTGDSASPDKEVLDAIRPAMSTIPGSILLGASSPYARKGVLYENFKQHYGKDDSPVLVWKASTAEMNPSINPLTIAAAHVRDSASARAEYGAEFRSDIESFIPVEVVDSCVVPGRFELPRLSGKQYFAFTDPSGGSSDSFTLAIAHAEDDGTVVLDLVREAVPPFSPDAVITEDAAAVKQYGQSEVEGDRYAGEFPRERFAKCGVHYKVAERTRSELYLELLPGLMSGRVRLLDNKRLIAQLSGLERRTARAGKESIDHGPGAHDDVANAAAGAIVAAMGAAGGVLGLLEFEKLEASGQLSSLKTQEWNKEFLFQFEAKTRGLQLPAPTEQWQEDPLPSCPDCKATIVTKLSAKEFRCAGCSKQWFKGGQAPRATRGQRGEYLAGRIPQARHFRFPGQR
jgi:terminase large subunit-like protein